MSRYKKVIPFILVGLMLVINSLSPVKISSNFGDLLPKKLSAGEWELPFSELENKLSKQAIFLIKESKSLKDLSSNSLREFSSIIEHSQLFKNVRYKIEASTKSKMYSLYWEYKDNLLSESDRKLIQSKKVDQILKLRLSEIYSPFGLLPLNKIKEDPLGYFNRYMLGKKSKDGALSDELGQLYFKHDGNNYFMYQTQIDHKVKNIESKLLKFYEDNKLLVKENMGATLIGFSKAMYLAKGNQLAMQEASFLSIISILFIVFIFLFFFKSIRPIFYVLTIICCSSIFGFTVAGQYFTNLHIISLLFSISIIGLVVDYAIHFFMLRGEVGEINVLNIVRPLVLACLSSIIGYGLLSFSGLSVLIQTSIFSISGLVVGLILVLYWLPQFNYQSLKPFKVKFNSIINKKWLCICGLFLIGLPFLSFNDDVTKLRPYLSELSEDERIIRKVVNLPDNLSYFLFKGKSVEELLIAEESFKTANNLINSRSLSDFLPSSQAQMNNRKLMSSTNKDKNKLLKKLGIGKVFQQDNFKILNYQTYIEKVGDDLFENLWIGQLKDGNFYSYMIADKKLLDNLPNTKKFDRLQNYSNFFTVLRKKMTFIYLFCIFIILLFLMFFMPIKSALQSVLVPFSAVLMSLVICNFFSELNIFHILATILVFTLGLDYSLFYHFANPSEIAKVFGAVLMSLLTSVAAFAILIFSSTPAVSSFGSVVFIGLILVFILSSVLGYKSSAVDNSE